MRNLFKKSTLSSAVAVFMAVTMVLTAAPMTAHANLPGDTATPPGTTNVSDAHRNAWRPTNPAFIEMAISLEVLADTILSRDGFTGVLYTFFNGNTGTMQPIHGNRYYTGPGSVDGLRAGIAGALFGTEAFHTWANQNRTAIGNLAPLAFSDVTGTEPFARDLVLLAYYNVIGNRHGTGRMQFNSDNPITKHEAIEMFRNFPLITDPSPAAVRIHAEMFEGVVPDWSLDAWISVSSRLVDRDMNERQVREITGGNLNRIEAALYIAEFARTGIGWSPSANEGRRTTTNTQTFRIQATNRFSDLNLTAHVEFDTRIAGTEHRQAQRTGTAPLGPDYTWLILQMADTGIIPGFADNTWRPYETVTRAEFIQMLVRAREVGAREAEARAAAALGR